MFPKVSIIIPVYNVENYLHQCLDSAMNQTLREIEIICVDDGSTDGSRAVLDEYAAKDGRVSVIHQENAGQAAARNNALKGAKGKYVLFLDSDDLLAETACQAAYEKAKASDADLVHFQYSAFGETSYSFTPEPILLGEWTDPLKKVEMLHQIPAVWQYLYKHKLLEDNQIAFPEKQKFEDVIFVYQARFLANKIIELPEQLYRYRVGSGYSTSVAQEQSYFELPVAYNRMIETLILSGASEDVRQVLYTRKLKEVYFAWLVKKRVRKEFAKRIAANLLPEERQIVSNSQILDKKTRTFYLSITGSVFQKVFYSLKYKTANLWDWFVERLYYRSSLYKKHEDEVQWLKTVIANHDEFFKTREEKRQ